MTFEELGGVGEFVGALAVVVSLIYVARQVRENSRSTRLAATQAYMESAQRIIEMPAADRDLARVIRVGGGDPDSLTEDEYAQFRYWMILCLRSTENLFIHHSSGMIDNETWLARSGVMLWAMETTGGRRVWKDVSNRYRPDFQGWINSSGKQ